MKKLFIATLSVIFVMLFTLAVSAAVPAKPDLGVEFGEVSEIADFTPSSQLYVGTTERVLLSDGNGGYVTYPTYYITKDSTTFDVDWSKLNGAQSIKFTNASVVMLEVPNGVTTISDRAFTGALSSCVYYQLPGSVTTYGKEMFNNNRVVKVVEFLDGETPVTIGDAIFGGNWNGGPQVEYVKFPNNLVSLGNNAFGKNTAPKTIILGENLETIGTGFFNESTPRTTDTFIYVSENFFKDTSKMFSNLFGSHANYHNNHLRLTLFYVGSLEKAQAFVEAGKALQSGYVYDNVTFVDASEYVYETHKPTADMHMTIVYNTNKCDAFYGEHAEDTNPCLISCDRCGMAEQDPNAQHTFGNGVCEYPNGFGAEGAYVVRCQNEGCALNVNPDSQKLDALFTCLGHSVSETYRSGIVLGFKVNNEAIEQYKALSGNDIEFGVFAASQKKLGENSVLGADGTEADGVIKANLTNTTHTVISVKVYGFTTDEQKAAKLAIGAYVIVDDGAELDISYIQEKAPADGDAYYFASYNELVA